MESQRFGRFEIRPQARLLLADGEPVALGARAFDLLLALLERRDRLTSTRELLDCVWPGLVVEENNLRQQVTALRRVLGVQSIANVARRGYRLVLEPDGASAGSQPVRVDHAVERAGDALRLATSMQPVVGVLPFTNLATEAARDHFADAVARDVIGALTRHRWLTVLPAGTTFGYRAASGDLPKVAEEIGADYLVEGGVLRHAERLRVQVELIDCGQGSVLWAERYERQIDDVFAMLDEISQAIAARIEPEIAAAERQRVERAGRESAGSAVANLQAWDGFHLGLSHLYRFTAAGNREALRWLQHSRAVDPEFGAAHAWWAYATVLDMVYWETEPSAALLDAALAAAQRALELDGQNGLFFALRGRVRLARQESRQALEDCVTSIELNPTLAMSHCALGDALVQLDRHEEAMACFERALRLSPRDPQRWAFCTYAALAKIVHGDHEAAQQWAARAEQSPNCSYWTPAHAAVALAHLGRMDEARAALVRARVKLPTFGRTFADAKLFYLPEIHRQHYLDGLRRVQTDG